MPLIWSGVGMTKNFLFALLILLPGLGAGISLAADDSKSASDKMIFKCIAQDETVTFTDSHCPPGMERVERLDAIVANVVPAKKSGQGDINDLGVGEFWLGDIRRAVLNNDWVRRLMSEARYWRESLMIVWDKSMQQEPLASWHKSISGWPAQWIIACKLAAIYLLMSLWCYGAYRRDKLAAISGVRRTPERRLHLYELLGGWPGALLAQQIMWHKTSKQPYQLIFWLIVLLHLCLLVDYFVLDAKVVNLLIEYIGRLSSTIR